VEGQFQGANGNNIKTCQTRRGLILPGDGADAPDADFTAAVTIMNDGVDLHKDGKKDEYYKDGKKDEYYKDGKKDEYYKDGHKDEYYKDGHKDEYYKDGKKYYKGDEDYKSSDEYSYDKDSYDSYKKTMKVKKPFKGVDVVFSPVVVAPDAPPAPRKRYGDKYDDDEDEYAYNEEDAEYYNVKFDDWEDASTEQNELTRFGNDVKQCRPRVTRGSGQASIAAVAAVAPQQNKGRLPETPAALRLTIHCKQPPQGQQNCVVRAQLVVAFTGDLADVAK